MQAKPVKCPNCKKTLTYYVEGYATYQQKCRNCKKTVEIYSAAKTVIILENKY